MADRKRRGARHARYRAGLGLSTRENAPAFAFSIMITSAFGAVSALDPSPSGGDIFLFATGAISGFTGTALLTAGLDDPKAEPERTDIVLFASALSLFSVLAAVAVAALVGWLGTGWYVWLLAPFGACVTYLLVNGFEYTVAEREEDGG